MLLRNDLSLYYLTPTCNLTASPVLSNPSLLLNLPSLYCLTPPCSLDDLDLNSGADQLLIPGDNFLFQGQSGLDGARGQAGAPGSPVSVRTLPRRRERTAQPQSLQSKTIEMMT